MRLIKQTAKIDLSPETVAVVPTTQESERSYEWGTGAPGENPRLSAER
jgi:hypothetical protein